MLRSMTNIISARKLCVKSPMLSRWRPRQSFISILSTNHCPIDFQIATFTRTPINFKYKDPKERETCPIPPPLPPPPPKDDRMFWAVFAMLLGAGGFAVYAKNNPEIRDWLTLNAPWFDDIIAVIFQENMTFGELATAFIDDTKRYLDKFKDDSIEPKPKECSTDGAHVKDCPPEPPKEKEKIEVCTPPPPPVQHKSICEVEKCLSELAECALNNYHTAKEACYCYNALVQETMESFTYKGLKELRHAMEERIELVKTSLDNAAICITKIDDLARYVECGTRASKDQIRNTKLMYQDYSERLKARFMKYQWENDKSVVMDRQWQMVEELVDKYTSANEAMFSGLKYSSQKPHLAGDLDALFTNTLRYIQELQSQLNDASGAMTERVDRAIEDLPQKKDPKFTAALANAIKDKKAEAVKDIKRREDEQKARNDRELKEIIKKQNESHEKSLAAKLKQIEQQMERTARSVALIEQEGAAMPVYVLSWLQGLLLFMKMTGIPQGEFEKPPLAPPDHLDTFDLLQRARFWIERGNLAVAVRYVESLKGASRAAAKKWFDEARAHLEVRQAAEAVLAHAAALGLRYI